MPSRQSRRLRQFTRRCRLRCLLPPARHCRDARRASRSAGDAALRCAVYAPLSPVFVTAARSAVPRVVGAKATSPAEASAKASKCRYDI